MATKKKLRLAVLALALGLSACAPALYEYDYDPYLGVRGHYVGAFEGRGHAPGPACVAPAYAGPYEAAWRGPYVSGPYCAQPPPP